MPYLHCRRCGLRIKIQATFLRMANCPRCLARSAMVAPLVLTIGDRDTHPPSERRQP